MYWASEPPVCGPDAARFFYDEDHVRRHTAIPGPIQSTLFGHGAVHTLDGSERRCRKAVFLTLVNDETTQQLVTSVGAAWDEVVPVLESRTASGADRRGQPGELVPTAPATRTPATAARASRSPWPCYEYCPSGWPGWSTTYPTRTWPSRYAASRHAAQWLHRHWPLTHSMLRLGTGVLPAGKSRPELKINR